MKILLSIFLMVILPERILLQVFSIEGVTGRGVGLCQKYILKPLQKDYG
jgi:hypothetical protein